MRRRKTRRPIPPDRGPSSPACPRRSAVPYLEAWRTCRPSARGRGASLFVQVVWALVLLVRGAPAAAWQSTGESSRVDGVEAPRHRADSMKETASRRWRRRLKFDFHTDHKPARARAPAAAAAARPDLTLNQLVALNHQGSPTGYSARRAARRLSPAPGPRPARRSRPDAAPCRRRRSASPAFAARSRRSAAARRRLSSRPRARRAAGSTRP